jgi:hypothetical protein
VVNPFLTDEFAMLPFGNFAIKSPFRRSVWRRTDNYLFAAGTRLELETTSFVFDVVAAKLRIPFPSVRDCNELAKQTDALPDEPRAVPPVKLVEALESFLLATKVIKGVGIPIAICFLAVRKNGTYAPLDIKLTKGMLSAEAITEEQAKSLTDSRLASFCVKSVRAFVETYVYSVLPVWHQSLQKLSPEEADAYWASLAPRRSRGQERTSGNYEEEF